jgi:hypothetical protein
VAATPSLKVTKSTAWRTGTRLWSNRYHFNGGTPAASADWTTLADAVVTAEKAIYTSDTTIVQVDGYAAGSDVPIFTKTYTTAGTLTLSGSFAQELQVCMLVRFDTTAVTSKNHPVYLFNYVHAVFQDANTHTGDPHNTQSTAVATYATAWIAGFSDGTNTLVRAGPNGATATARVVESWLTHRDFPT